MDKELESLREEALKAIIALPPDKQTELWDIVHYFKGGEQNG